MATLSYPDVLNICVQSKIFYVSVNLIKKQDDNFFTPLLPGNWAEKPNNVIIVDRDPKIFKHVLDFLIGYPLDVECPSNTFDRLYIDAKFYAFTNLVKILEEMKTRHEENANIPQEYHDCTLEDMIQTIPMYQERGLELTSRVEAFAFIDAMKKEEQNSAVKMIQVVLKAVYNSSIKPQLEKKFGSSIDFSSSELDTITLAISKYML